MKSKLVPLVVVLCVSLGGCYVRLPIADAVAEPVTDAEAAALNEKGERPATAGEWFHVRATLPRAAVRQIARWQLYTHLKVEHCRTGELVGIKSSVGVEDTGGDFKLIEQKLRSNEQRETFVIAEPIFVRAGDPADRLCVRLSGGSYTLQRISSSPIPLRLQRREG